MTRAARDRRIRDPADLEAGAAHLMQVCPVWARELPALLPLAAAALGRGLSRHLRCGGVASRFRPMRRMRSRRAWRRRGWRMRRRLPQRDEDALRAAGLSRPKIRYLRGIAQAGIDWPGCAICPMTR
jgi:DNA-3-methyladenine glycosylase II